MAVRKPQNEHRSVLWTSDFCKVDPHIHSSIIVKHPLRGVGGERTNALFVSEITVVEV